MSEAALYSGLYCIFQVHKR